VNLLLEVRKLSLGYDRPLFKGLTFSIAGGNVVEIRGRNGAGKTTLIKAIMAQAAGGGRNELVLSGEIIPSQKLKLGYYEQEIGESGMNLTLASAVTKAHEGKGAAINDEKCRQVMAQYLFNPAVDGKTKVGDLSGGEKARLQIIRMLANNPNLLVLDEPTNHLDLPSIEELEKALAGYHGAVLFVSHDGYFTRTLAAEVVRLGRA
jgi:ATPase subunit of ABC transporter with duplicated ATPase domains